MKFNLYVVKNFYTDPKEINDLKELGFTFTKEEKHATGHWIDDYEGLTIEINTIDEMIKFIEKYDEIIIHKSESITIYNDYIE